MIRFDFTVPERILATACGHEGRIHGEHTQLPPTLEDSSEGPQRSCTERTTIRHRVVARLWEATDDQDRARRALIAIKSIKIHSVPSTATSHTVTASTLDEFSLHQEVRLRARTSGKDNTPFISATKPRPLTLDLSAGVNRINSERRPSVSSHGQRRMLRGRNTVSALEVVKCTTTCCTHVRQWNHTR